MKSKKIILWPAADAVYILAMYLNRCGTVKGYEGFTVSCPTRWLQDAQRTEAVMQKLRATYAWKNCHISLVVGGEDLIWKQVSLPVKQKEQAGQLSCWELDTKEENIGYTYDVMRISEADTAGMYTWILGAYPENRIYSLCDLLQQQNNKVDAVDALPCCLARQAGGHTGTVYLHEGHTLHAAYIRGGVPLTYGTMRELPAGGSSLLQERGQSEQDDFILWFDEETQVWQTNPLFIWEERCRAYGLSFPVGVLTD